MNKIVALNVNTKMVVKSNFGSKFLLCNFLMSALAVSAETAPDGHCDISTGCHGIRPVVNHHGVQNCPPWEVSHPQSKGLIIEENFIPTENKKGEKPITPTCMGFSTSVIFENSGLPISVFQKQFLHVAPNLFERQTTAYLGFQSGKPDLKSPYLQRFEQGNHFAVATGQGERLHFFNGNCGGVYGFNAIVTKEGDAGPYGKPTVSYRHVGKSTSYEKDVSKFGKKALDLGGEGNLENLQALGINVRILAAKSMKERQKDPRYQVLLNVLTENFNSVNNVHIQYQRERGTILQVFSESAKKNIHAKEKVYREGILYAAALVDLGGNDVLRGEPQRFLDETSSVAFQNEGTGFQTPQDSQTALKKMKKIASQAVGERLTTFT